MQPEFHHGLLVLDAGVAAAYALITIALTYPLVRALGSAFPHDAGDPVLNTWLLWWSTQKVPLTTAWWNAPMFYPMRGAMALSELLIGLLPITAPVQWLTGSPLIAYNIAFLVSFPLCGLAAYALALEVTGRRDAAFLAGLVFAFGPYRMNQLSHIQMLSYYWAPVSLFALHRYAGLKARTTTEVDARSPDRVARSKHTVWLVVFAAAWLLQGLSNGYALFHFSVLVLLWLIWFVRTPRALLPIAVAWVAAALPLLVPLLKYREVHGGLHLARDINEIQRFSADIASVVSAPPDVLIWGGRLLSSHFETAIFPGLVVVTIVAVAATNAFRQRTRSAARWRPDQLALAGFAIAFALIALSVVVAGPWSIGRVVTVGNAFKPFSLAVLAVVLLIGGAEWMRRAWSTRSAPVFYAASAVVMYVLSLGPAPALAGRQVLYEPPYAWLMRLPGFDTLRVPSRFAMLALLCQAVVVAAAWARWSPRAIARKSIAIAVISAGLVADGWIRLPLEAAPNAQSPAWQGVNAVIELPPGEPIVDFPAIYRSIFHGQPVVNGFSGFAPPHYLPLVYAIVHGQFGALEEIAADGPLGVAVDRSIPWRQNMEMFATQLPGAKPFVSDDRWTAFVVTGRPRAAVNLGRRIQPAAVRANRQAQDVPRLADGRIESAWGPGTPQDGSEEVVADLGSVQPIGTIVLEMGAYSFGFPRDLAIDLSTDGQQWQTVWRGDAAVGTVRAALADPGVVPLTFELDRASGRFVRLRQLGRDPLVPWWIAELRVHGAK